MNPRPRGWWLLPAAILLLALLGQPVAAALPIQSPTPTPDADLKERATALGWEGIDLYNQKDYQGALVKYQQALPLYQQAGDRSGEAATLHFIGRVYSALSDLEQALTYNLQALPIYQEIGNRYAEAGSLHRIGVIYRDSDEFAQALAYLLPALSIWQEIGNAEEEAKTLTAIASVYNALSDYPQALAFLERALPIQQEIGDRAGEAATLYLLGVVYDALSDYEQSLVFHLQGLSICRQLGRQLGEVIELNSIGVVYLHMSDYEQSLIYLEQALSIEREIGERQGEAGTLNNMGLAYAHLSDLVQAADSFQQSLVVFRELEDLSGEATALQSIGNLYRSLHEYEQALIYLEQALSTFEELGRRQDEAGALNNIALSYYSLPDYQQALTYAQRALTLFQEIGDRAGQARMLGVIGMIREKQGDEAEALDFYLQAIAVHEAVRAGVRVEAFQAALASREVTVYEHATRLLVARGRGEEAFSLSERNRARAFLDTMGNERPDLRQGADADLLRREEVLRNELAALETSLAGQVSTPAAQRSGQVTEAVKAQLAAKQQEYEDLLAQIQLSSPELASLVTIPAATLAGTQALLDNHTALVAYYLTDRNVLAFVLSRQEFHAVVLPATPEEIANAVESFRTLALANLANAHPRSLTDLYEWLVAPLSRFLTSSKLGIIAHQSLHYVPFAALSDGERYLGQQFALFHLPSASSLPFVLAKTGREISDPLILGDPGTDNADLPRLDYAAQEAWQVAQLFGTQPLVGQEATEATLRTQIGGAGLLHLAAHGAFNPAAPLFSHLWLASGGDEDGRLNVHEVYGLDLDRTDLVVLSACQTQLGELSAGDEVVGLTRAFLYGTPTVVASLWSVDDEATGALMARFYSHLLAGMGKAEALQAAQADVRDDPEHPDWAHPYYWAAFVLSGDPGPVSAPAPIMAPTAATVPAPTLVPATVAASEASDGPWIIVGVSLGAMSLALIALIFIRIRRRRRESAHGGGQ